MYIITALKKIIRSNPALFTTPGHSQGESLPSSLVKMFGKKIFKTDLSEVEGIDSLHNPCSAIYKSMRWAADIYGSKQTFFLINGSSSGIIALMLATVKKNDKVLIARNTHKSIISALTLSGANPVWIESEWDSNFNIPAQICPKKIRGKIQENPDAKALWITSPTYEGIASDITAISKLCREKNILLLVDEAHGALFPFSEKLPESAISLGADASVQSLHKTSLALNQGAVLHIGKKTEICSEKIQQCLNLINTTSPSYVLLSSIEASIQYMNSPKGLANLDKLITYIEKTKHILKNQAEAFFLESTESFQHDPMRMCFGLKNISGYDLSNFLFNRYKIEDELNNNVCVLALVGLGSSEKKLHYLTQAVLKASKLLNKSNLSLNTLNQYISPKVALSPEETFYKDSRLVSVADSVGEIAAETVVNYPPGIPLVIAGEVIQEEHLQFLIDKKTIEVVRD